MASMGKEEIGRRIMQGGVIGRNGHRWQYQLCSELPPGGRAFGGGWGKGETPIATLCERVVLWRPGYSDNVKKPTWS